MKSKLKNYYKKITPQHIFLVCSLILILFPIIVSASESNYWELPQWGKDIGHKGTIINQAGATAFYQEFHLYLTPLWGILGPLVSVGGRLVQFIVALPGIFQDIFFGAVKLLGIYTQLSDQQTELGKLFILMQQLGAIVFGMTFIIYFSYVIFNGKSKTVKKVMETAILLFLVIGFIPWGLNKAFAMSSAAISDTSKATTPDIGLTLIQNNVVDKEMLTMKDWDVKLDSSGVVENPAKNNQIKSVYGWDPGEMLGVANVDLLEKLDEEKKKTSETKQNYFQNIFKSQLVTYPAVNGGAGDLKEKQEAGGINYHKQLTAANYLEANYLRYKVNWLPLIISAVSISLIYIMMTLKVGTSAFVTVMTTIASPVLAALKSKSPKKVKEEMGHILAGAYSVFFEFLIVVVAMYMMLWINSSSATEIIAKTGLSAIQIALLKCFFYVGLFFGVMSGVQAIERFIGISTSHQNPMQQMASTMIVAGGLAKGSSAMWDAVKTGGGNTFGELEALGRLGQQRKNNKDKGNDDYMSSFTQADNKNEENPYHSNENNEREKEKEKENQNKAQEQNMYNDDQSDKEQEKSQDKQNGYMEPQPEEQLGNYNPENDDSENIEQPDGWDAMYSDGIDPEAESRGSYVPTRKEKAMESLNKQKGIERDSSDRPSNNEESYTNQKRQNEDYSGGNTTQSSGDKKEQAHQEATATTLNDRVNNMEERYEKQQKQQQQSQRAQEAAQRIQKRQMSGQQIQMGMQRMQGAAQNQFAGPVEEEEE